MNKILAFLFIFPLSFSFAQAQNTFELMEVGEGTQCYVYVVRDSHKRILNLPANVKRGLECPHIIDLHNDMICFMDYWVIKLYDIRNFREIKLMKVYPDMDGYCGPCWSPSSKKAAFIMINKKKLHDYPEMARIIVLTFDDSYNIVKKQHFDCDINFECESDVCRTDCSEDLRFVDDDILMYRQHKESDDDPGMWIILHVR